MKCKDKQINKQNTGYTKSPGNKEFLEKLTMLDRPLAKLRKEKRKEIFIKLIYKEKYHNRY